MAFVDQKSMKQRSAGMTGAIIFPAALGAIFISGLAVTDFPVPPIIEDFEAIDIKLPPPPPQEEIVESNPQKEAAQSTVVAPKPPIEVSTTEWTVKTIEKLPDLGGEVIPIAIPSTGDIGPAMPTIIPAIATPRNDPGRWVTTSDYRTSWINREWTGTARFELQVSARGRVNDCRITKSTGHSALDRATCDLITRRARFEPATDASGQAVSGTYSSAILWQLPE